MIQPLFSIVEKRSQSIDDIGICSLNQASLALGNLASHELYNVHTVVNALSRNLLLGSQKKSSYCTIMALTKIHESNAAGAKAALIFSNAFYALLRIITDCTLNAIKQNNKQSCIMVKCASSLLRHVCEDVLIDCGYRIDFVGSKSDDPIQTLSKDAAVNKMLSMMAEAAPNFRADLSNRLFTARVVGWFSELIRRICVHQIEQIQIKAETVVEI